MGIYTLHGLDLRCLRPPLDRPEQEWSPALRNGPKSQRESSPGHGQGQAVPIPGRGLFPWTPYPLVPVER